MRNLCYLLKCAVILLIVFGISSQITSQSLGYDLNYIIYTEGTENPVDDITPIDESELTTDTTLDVVNWNVDWLGAPTMTDNVHGTRNQHLANVGYTLYELDADVIALQEVVVNDTYGNAIEDLVEVMNRLTGYEKYEGVWSDFHSYYWEEDDPDYPPQCLAFIWNTDVVTVNNDSALLQDIASSTDFGYGRLPFLLDADVTLNGYTQRYMFIDLHLKAYSDYSSNRAESMELLRSLLNVNFYDNNVMLIGDYNVADDPGATGEIADWGVYDDNEEDGLIDYVHACGGKSSSGSNNIEHILISTELFDELAYIPEDQRNIMVSGTGEDGYSSHYAFMTRLLVHEETGNVNPGTNDIYDRTKGLTMLSSDYQTIVDYVKNDSELSRLDDCTYDDSEYYFGASAYYCNFDIRDGKHYSGFESWEDAVKTAISTILLPDVYTEATADSSIIYTVYFDTYDGSNGSGSYNFICIKSAPDPEFVLYTGETAVETIEASSDFMVYPNPTGGSFYITVNSEMQSVQQRISIFDINGKRVFSKYLTDAPGNNVYLDVNLKPGCYIVELNGSDTVIQKQLIVR